MWSYEAKVSLPNELTKEMTIHTTFISPTKPEVGVLVLTKGLHQLSKEIVVRLYRLQKKSLDESYYIINELEALMFTSFKAARAFLNNLPNMTGLEMLLLLNPMSKTSKLQ